jgi:hypothetical protein
MPTASSSALPRRGVTSVTAARTTAAWPSVAPVAADAGAAHEAQDERRFLAFAGTSLLGWG